MTARAAMAVGLAAIVITGCSLFHSKETPQQRYIDALNRGNSAVASQVWFKMSQEDRNKLRRGEGIAPAVSPEQALKMAGPHDLGEDTGPITIAPNPGGGLMDLPRALGQQTPAQSPPAGDGQ